MAKNDTIEKLQAQIAKVNAEYKAAVAALITAALAEHGLTVDDLYAAAPKKAAPAKKKPATKAAPKKVVKKTNKRKGPQPPMYRDPESGATWSGRARPPAWIKDVADRTPFLIQ